MCSSCSYSSYPPHFSPTIIVCPCRPVLLNCRHSTFPLFASHILSLPPLCANDPGTHSYCCCCHCQCCCCPSSERNLSRRQQHCSVPTRCCCDHCCRHCCRCPSLGLHALTARLPSPLCCCAVIALQTCRTPMWVGKSWHCCYSGATMQWLEGVGHDGSCCWVAVFICSAVDQCGIITPWQSQPPPHPHLCPTSNHCHICRCCTAGFTIAITVLAGRLVVASEITAVTNMKAISLGLLGSSKFTPPGCLLMALGIVSQPWLLNFWPWSIWSLHSLNTQKPKQTRQKCLWPA